MTDMQESIARGYPLNQETFEDFVNRLKYDRFGKGVEYHYTRDPIFIVERLNRIYGYDLDCVDSYAVIIDDSCWDSIEKFYNECDDDIKQSLELFIASNTSYVNGFLNAPTFEQMYAIESIDGARISGYQDVWEYVCSHFTREAADAFIKRKSHDYPLGLRIYVDSQSYCWEFNAIVDAIAKGNIIWKSE